MKRILLVEDDDAIRRSLEAVLAKSGFIAVEAANGRDALAAYDPRRIDAVVLDLIMPDMEGLETLRALRRISTDVRVLAISGGGQKLPDDLLETALQFGARETLAKPFTSETFIQTLNRVLADPSPCRWRTSPVQCRATEARRAPECRQVPGRADMKAQQPAFDQSMTIRSLPVRLPMRSETCFSRHLVIALHEMIPAKRRGVTRIALLMIIIGGAFTPVLGAAADRQLTTAKEVGALSSEEAATRLPIRLSGVVTFLNEEKRVLFVQDETGGIFVEYDARFPACEAGSQVEILGRSGAGRYNPIVTLASMQVVGKGAFPRTNPVALADLWSGSHDCNWVTVRAHVQSCEIEGRLTCLKLAHASTTADAWVNNLPVGWLPHMDFAEVEFSGPSSVAVTDARKIIGISLWLPDTNLFRILRTGAKVIASLPEASFQSLVTTNLPLDSSRPIRIRGTVTHASRRSGIQLQEGTLGLTLFSHDQALPPAGRRIEAIGWPHRAESKTEILGARVREIGIGTAPVPLSVSIRDMRRGTGQGTVVTMEGVLRHRMVANGDALWILEQDGVFLKPLFRPEWRMPEIPWCPPAPR